MYFAIIGKVMITLNSVNQTFKSKNMATAV